MGFWGNFWDVIWFVFWIFAFTAYLMVLFSIIGDLFRDHKLNGWFKAIWILFLVFVPWITALVYLIARGRGMAERRAADYTQAKSDTDAYIRSVSTAGSTPSDQIAKAKGLLDSGAITQAEFDTLKAHALAGTRS
jgi:Short C-terminal domain/Phospholipase_D-nuclease N-terminal